MKTTVSLYKYEEGVAEYGGEFLFEVSYGNTYARVILKLGINAFGDAPVPQELEVEVDYERPS